MGEQMTDGEHRAGAAAVANDGAVTSTTLPTQSFSPSAHPSTLPGSLPPHSDTQPDPSAELAARLGAQLQPSLAAFEGQPLARFEWSSADGLPHACEARLESARIHRASKTTVTIKLVPASGDPALFALFIYTYSTKDGAVRLRCDGAGRMRDWLLVESGAVPDWAAGASGPRSFYPYPNNMPSIDFFGLTWFSNEDASLHNVQIRRKRAGDSPALGAIKAGWPSFVAAGKKKRKWQVNMSPVSAEPSCPQWGARVLSFCLWTVLLAVHKESCEDDDTPSARELDLPGPDEYFPRRPVDLRTNEVLRILEDKTPESPESLSFPWHVVEAACAALNARKNVIFTGPPGCGKTKLALALARIATGQRPLVATASPAWTSGDLVGRYVPERSGKGLEFHPGHFLRAVASNRWLVVDEFNRANIDECFGELFSVLAGDTVELPFRAPLDCGADDDIDAPLDGNVRIVPSAQRANGEAGTQFCDYQVSPAFRMIGTMNDADRASLHQLSFALQRRFDIIRVEAPGPKIVAQIIEKALDDNFDAGEAYRFQLTKNAMKANDKYIRVYLTALFANEATTPGEFGDLVSERIVGIATVLDVLRLVLEGLRCPSQPGERDVIELDDAGQRDPETALDARQLPAYVAASYVALGVALSVFPQLEALQTDEDLLRAVTHVVDVFRSPDGASLPFLRIQPGETGFIAARERAGGQMIDQDNDGLISIPEFLVSELTRQFSGTGREAMLESIIAQEPNKS